MTSHAGRSLTLAVIVLVFFVLWAAIAARPWATTATDRRFLALQQRELRLRSEAAQTRRVVARRWAAYRVALRARRQQIATARRQARLASVQTPTVRVVNLPPITITRTS